MIQSSNEDGIVRCGANFPIVFAMPVYTVAADIYNVMSQKVAAELTDDTDGTTPDVDRIEDALERAEGIVDSYLSKQVTIPLVVPVSGAVRHYVLTLATCYLFKRRRGTLTEELENGCRAIMEELKKIGTGESEVPGATELPEGADTDTDDRVFTVQVFK